MILYHATLKSNLDGIIEKGIDPSFSKGAEQCYLATHRRA